MTRALKFRCAAATDPGRRRSNNEDRYLCDPERGIYAVVDGMGGEAAGEQAAQIAVDMLRARLERPTGGAAERMREAIAVANNGIYEAARSNPAWQGMACVLTAVIVERNRAVVGHVGDSRLYLLSRGAIRKITHDHSPVGEREDRGELDELEAMRHPRRNEVFRDVGSAPHHPGDDGFIETAELPLDADSALLVASDGLSDLVTSAQIRKIVESTPGDPDAAVRALVAAANAAGGKDNITVVLVEGPAYKAPLQASRAAGALTGRWPFLAGGVLLGLLLFWAGLAAVKHTGGGPAKAAPRTWHVGAAATADAATISAVLEKARPGDTVLVAPGEYRELVRIPEGVHLASMEPRAALLRAAESGVAVQADGVRRGRISGFLIAGDDRHPLEIGVQAKDSSVILEDLEITGARTAGVEVLGGGNPVLRLNRIVRNPGTGIAVRDSAAPQLLDNLIADNGKAPGALRPGLQIRGHARVGLRGNTFFDNGAEAIWAAPGAAPDAAMLDLNRFGAPEQKGAARRRVRTIP